jgi:EAL domain-containing protein (putative c-di-GMP-specific phosphodiesterase class I)
MQAGACHPAAGLRRPATPVGLPEVTSAIEKLDQFGLRLFWQPILHAATAPHGLPIRREALLRRKDARDEAVFPAATVNALRRRSSAAWFDLCVLQAACMHAAAWEDGTTIAVNMSPETICRPDVVDAVEVALTAAGLPAHRLQIEITEEGALNCPCTASAVIRALQARGVSVALDDFGAGASCWATLQALPVDTLKLDGHFTRHVVSSEKGRVIVRGIIAMAHALGMRVCVECVETSDQLTVLQDLGCDEVQGFLLGRPRPLALAGSMAAGLTLRSGGPPVGMPA